MDKSIVSPFLTHGVDESIWLVVPLIAQKGSVGDKCCMVFAVKLPFLSFSQECQSKHSED